MRSFNTTRRNSRRKGLFFGMTNCICLTQRTISLPIPQVLNLEKRTLVSTLMA